MIRFVFILTQILTAMAKYQTFLINLEKRSDKLKSSKFQLNYLNISFNLFKAVDGEVLRNQINQNKTVPIAELVGIKNLKLKREALGNTNDSMNHIGCWLSHLKLLQQIEDLKIEDNILILEDDFIADGNAVYLIDSAISNLPNDWDLFYAGHCDTSGRCAHFLKDYSLCKTYQQIACTHGYILRNYTVASKIFEKGNSEEPLLADLYYERAAINRFLVFPHIFTQRKTIMSDVRSEGGVFTNLRNSTLKTLVEKYY